MNAGSYEVAGDMLKEFLPVFDNLERAMQSAQRATEVKPVADGLTMILKQFLDTVGRAGITKVATKGAPFDPTVHEAIQQVESEEEPGTVVAEVQAGLARYGYGTPQSAILDADTVKVIAGKSKGIEGKVIAVLREEDRVIVEGANLVKKHTKSIDQGGRAGKTGGIITTEAPIHVSNVMLVSGNGTTRIGFKREEVSKRRAEFCAELRIHFNIRGTRHASIREKVTHPFFFLDETARQYCAGFDFLARPEFNIGNKFCIIANRTAV